MLPPAARLRNSSDFRRVFQRGFKAAAPRRVFVVHAFVDSARYDASPRVGLVISRAVGNAVIRHRVARRLRHLMISRIPTLPRGLDLVFRVMPKAGPASSAQLNAEFEICWRRLMSGPMGRKVTDAPTVSS